MRAKARALAFVLPFCACAPSEPAERQPVALDCRLPFETLVAKVTAQPDLVPAPKGFGEPYRFYSTADGRASWLVTEPGASAHPAVMMQLARDGDVKTTGCAYGDKAGYQRLLTYLEGLKAWTRK